jgi:plasmid stabilization system protein ParE
MRAMPSTKLGLILAYRVKVGLAAKLDAKEHARFIITKAAPEAATRWLRILQKKVASLQEMPYRFDVIPESTDLEHEYRQFMHFSHRVIYRIDEQKATVYVVRVYHGGRKSPRSKDLE